MTCENAERSGFGISGPDKVNSDRYIFMHYQQLRRTLVRIIPHYKTLQVYYYL